MYATVQKWGNSQGIRIPKTLLDTLGIFENDRVELVQQEDSITTKNVTAPRHKTLEERLTAFYGKPLDQIPQLLDDEVDWGKAEGQEAW